MSLEQKIEKTSDTRKSMQSSAYAYEVTEDCYIPPPLQRIPGKRLKK